MVSKNPKKKLPAAATRKTPPKKALRSSGRPPRLSKAAIIETSIQLLDRGSADTFTLAQVAEELDTVSMALYNYFPSREALLGAVADRICMQFKMPKAKARQTWQDTLRAWLWTFKKHAERYPVIFKVLGIDGQTSAGWLRISMTVGKTLQEQGMEGKELALNAWLFCAHAVSLVMYELTDNAFRSPLSLSNLEALEPHEQQFFSMLRPFHIQISSSDALEEGFNQLILGLEFKLKSIGK
ncbi:MAG TPA: TetR/AcrR family transcriptional regulator [Spongiibacteraceae bacterium]|nr:TetR/AcrR family transcriptional regulator [Spongiibacteraceae bacterium]